MKNTKKSSPMRKKLRKLLLTVLIVLLLLLPYPFEVGGPFTFLLQNRYEIHAPVAGELSNVKVREGELVKKGAVIAELSTREQERSLAIVQADLDKAQAELHLLQAGPKSEEVEKAKIAGCHCSGNDMPTAVKETERLKEMFAAGAVPQEQYDEVAKRSSVDAQNLEVDKSNIWTSFEVEPVRRRLMCRRRKSGILK